MGTDKPSDRRVRYAVAGLGHIAQSAVLPAFAHATGNSELCALFSSDPEKRAALGARYRVPSYPYEEFEDGLRRSGAEAVYVCLPNHLHREFTERAARCGVHVLCEKPMAVTDEDCQAMLRACDENEVKLMVAYRLHFEEANLAAVDAVRSGRLGEVRLFSSVFSMNVRPGDIRVRAETGGGGLYDIGVYCINAARYLFRAEPEEAFAMTASGGSERFREVEEVAAAVLRFPDDRLATFACHLGGSPVSAYRIVGSKGDLRLDPAYDYAGERRLELTAGGRTERRTFEARDQFAPELLYFSERILRDEYPEPSGAEGLADVRVVNALYRSAGAGSPVKLGGFARTKRPEPSQVIRRPALKTRPELVRSRPPTTETP